MIVCRTIFTRVIDVNIDHMLGKLGHERQPTRITTAGVLDRGPINGIVLVVIMGDERGRAFVPSRFMIGIEIPKMPPAVLIDDFSPRKKRCYAPQWPYRPTSDSPYTYWRYEG